MLHLFENQSERSPMFGGHGLKCADINRDTGLPALFTYRPNLDPETFPSGWIRCTYFLSGIMQERCIFCHHEHPAVTDWRESVIEAVEHGHNVPPHPFLSIRVGKTGKTAWTDLDYARYMASPGHKRRLIKAKDTAKTRAVKQAWCEQQKANRIALIAAAAAKVKTRK